MQKFIASGNLCKDIELKTTQGGKSVLRNTIAIRNDYKNDDGKYGSEFINIVVWGKSAEFLSQYATKGSKLLIEGKITTRSYDKEDGTKGYATEVNCSSIEILDHKKNNEETSDDINDGTLDPYTEFGNQISINTDDLELPFE